MSIVTLHKGDLPDDINLGNSIAVDTETMGLQIKRDRLCLVQLSCGDGNAHLVQLDRETYDAPNLKRLMSDKNILKIFHFGRFDLAVMEYYLGITVGPVYCTKIASKLCRTYTDRHGLKDICKELIGIDLNKGKQSSDWGADDIDTAQQDYAASDVLYLHALKEKLDIMLERENRLNEAKALFDFLPMRAHLDLIGWDEVDIFAHSS